MRGETPESFTPEQYTRYSRHLILPEIGIQGQARLRRSKALVIGAGGLGSPAALYLAAAGVGVIGLVDFDSVDLTNLQRQILHGSDDVGRLKVDSARDRIQAMNPDVEVRKHPQRLNSENAFAIIGEYDVVIDGTDNFPTRYLANDACAMLSKPYVYGSIYRFDGQASVFHAGHGPCYRCLFPEPPPPEEVPSCAEGGVLGVLPGVIGSIQATECLKLLLDIGRPLIGRLILYNALDMTFRELKIKRNPACLLCGENPLITEMIDYEEFCGIYEDEPSANGIPRIEVEELNRRMEQGGELFVLDVRHAAETAFSPFPGATNIPADALERRLGEINAQRERQIAVICKDGRRSQRACEQLRAAGFADVVNVEGGILAWARRIDRQTPEY